jgi:Methyltransferase FkbM domain
MAFPLFFCFSLNGCAFPDGCKAEGNGRMIDARLPADLSPFPCADLIRIGRDHDGGYLASRADVLVTECLVGMGLNDDWSFEQHFARLGRCPVIAYDASVGPGVFFTQFRQSLGRGRTRASVSRKLRVLLGYLWFFRGRNVHIRRFVAKSPDHDTVDFRDVVRRIGRRRAFLKIDIEGAEYGLLDDIIAIAPQLSGLVIEFHDCPGEMEQILHFVGRIGLQLVHVHVNNCGLVAQDGTPIVVEMTFSSLTLGGQSGGQRPSGQTLPHPLDQTNCTTLPDIALRFEGVASPSARPSIS